MKSITRCSLRAIVLYFTILPVFTMPVFAQEASVVRVTQVNGTVLKNGAPVKEGELVQRDDTISCKEKSSAVLTWTNGSIMEIYPNTSIVLQGVMYEGDKRLEKTLMALENGRIFAKAQVPEHIFEQFTIKVGNTPLITQGAEFALKYDKAEKKVAVISLIGRVLVDTGMEMIRIEEEQMAKFQARASEITPFAMSDKTKKALERTSKRLGGSLLIDEESTTIGGPLKLKIGGVRNRRGNSPFNVKFKLMVSGGSGKIKSIKWNFGDGDEAEGKKAEHVFTQGLYGVTVHVEDENGDKASAQINISAETECAC